MTVCDDLAQVVGREAARARSFAELSASCEGAWPARILDELARRSDARSRELRDDASARTTRVEMDGRLPLPHPLDADWRFTRDSAHQVLDLALAATGPGREILLIAMPTVALAAHDRGVAHRVTIAVRDDPVGRALRTSIPEGRFVRVAELPRRSFHTVAIDPPWYDDVASSLIEIGLGAAAPDAHLLVCTPDRLTRASTASHLSRLRESPHLLGFSTAAQVARLRYETPFFEKRCLDALGVTNSSPNWRTGILLECSPPRQRGTWVGSGTAAAPTWTEIRYGPLRIWLRPVGGEQGAPPSVVLSTSVSRTDPLRASAELWTTGNTAGINLGTVDRAFPAATSDLEPWRWHERLMDALDEELRALKRTVDFS